MFKVTRHDNASINRFGERVYYEIGEWVKPRFGKLFVFDTIENTQNFIHDWGGFRLYRCEALNAERLNTMCLPIMWDRFEKFWKGQAVKYSTPTGTYGCDAVKLVERVNV